MDGYAGSRAHASDGGSASAMTQEPKVIRILITEEVLDLLSRHRVHLSTRRRDRLVRGDTLWALSSATIEPYTKFGAGANLYTCGSFSYSRSELPMSSTVGRYCSIGPGLKVLGRDHPIDRLSTSPFTYNSAIFEDAIEDFKVSAAPVVKRPRSRAMPIIQNDVWIGQDVTISRGVTIGNGAIIAAGALVTKSIPPYEIWGGSPARLIRPRFSPDVCARLEGLRWWRWAFPQFSGLRFDWPIEKTIGFLEEFVASGPAPYNPAPLAARDLLIEGR